MKWNVGTKLGVGFGLILLVLLIVGGAAYRGTEQLIGTSSAREHTYSVLGKLVDVLSLLLDMQGSQRGYVITGDEEYLEPYQVAQGQINRSKEDLRKLTSDNPRQQRRQDELDRLIQARLTLSREILDVRRTNGLEAAVELVKTGKGKENMEDIRKVLDEMRTEEEDLLKVRIDKAENDARNAQTTNVLGTLVALVLATLGAVLITRNIARPLRDLTGVAERITVGDLDVSLTSNGRNDEVGALTRTFARMTKSLQSMAGAAELIAAGDLRSSFTPQSQSDRLGRSFSKMTDNLREQTRQLIEGAQVLGSAASEIVASTSQLASSASESAVAVSQTTTTVEEVRQTAHMTNQKARAVTDSAQRTAQISQAGRQSTGDAAAGMDKIRQQMEAIAASMLRLSDQSHAIGQIIASVEDVAAQSNLLAVNAAIEAARAGEQGKGFVVVAQEVRNLANQSKQATNQVRTILTEIQKATAVAVLATEQGTKAVEAGERQTATAGESIQVLAGSVTEAVQAATQIAASSQQQLVGMDQVAAAMENIKTASNQNAASAKQLETAARNVNELGHRLKLIVERYRL
jgi:methyl-accepting chemotaxis protein